MNGIENAQFDLIEATHSVETALELLESMSHDDLNLQQNQELMGLIGTLKVIREELGQSCDKLTHIESH